MYLMPEPSERPVSEGSEILTQDSVVAMTRGYGDGLWTDTSIGGYPLPSAPMNWWQLAQTTSGSSLERFGPVHACVKIISEDMARTPVKHIRQVAGVREEVTNRAPARVFRKPNSYQTRTDFILYILRSLLLVDGNAYLYPKYNGRGEVDAIYPLYPKAVWPFLEEDTGEVFYRYSHDPTVVLAGMTRDKGEMWLPAREICHIRLHTPIHPLIGETPLAAAFAPALTGMEINHHVGHFFKNMSRPSGILKHPKKLDKESYERIKERFLERFSGPETGMPLILNDGMDWAAMTMNAVDAELIKSFELTQRQIAEVYRIPSFLMGNSDKSTIGNVESLIRFYIQSCLGFYVEHLQEAFNALFGLPPEERIVFDLEEALLRNDFKERMEAYSKGIQNAVLKPNEARKREGLPPDLEYGDDLRAQQQLVPLSYGAALQPPGSESSASPSADSPDDGEDDASGDNADGPGDTEDNTERDADSKYMAIKAELARIAA